MRSLVVGGALAASLLVGGLVGGLLSAYWWDFPEEEAPILTPSQTVAFYAVLGAVGGLIIGALVIAIVSVALELRGRRTTRHRT